MADDQVVTKAESPEEILDKVKKSPLFGLYLGEEIKKGLTDLYEQKKPYLKWGAWLATLLLAVAASISVLNSFRLDRFEKQLDTARKKIDATAQNADDVIKRIKDEGAAEDTRYTAQTQLLKDQSALYGSQINELSQRKGSLASSLEHLGDRVQMAGDRVDSLDLDVEKLASARRAFEDELKISRQTRQSLEADWNNSAKERTDALTAAQAEVGRAEKLLTQIAEQLKGGGQDVLGTLALDSADSDKVPNLDNLYVSFARQTPMGAVEIGYSSSRPPRFSTPDWPTLTLAGVGSSVQIPKTAVSVMLFQVRNSNGKAAVDLLFRLVPQSGPPLRAAK